MKHRDPCGYYRALNVNPSASDDEIQLAYNLLRQGYRNRSGGTRVGLIQAAYDTLGDPERRARYDGRAGGRLGPWQPRKLSQPALLGLLMAGLAFLVLLRVWPAIRIGMVEFSPGDTLYHQTSGAYFGVVVEYDAAHRFFNGAFASAYLVQQQGGAEPVWYPERDLKRIAAR